MLSITTTNKRPTETNHYYQKKLHNDRKLSANHPKRPTIALKNLAATPNHPLLPSNHPKRPTTTIKPSKTTP